METPKILVSLVMANLLWFGMFVGCSQQGGGSKKVNLQEQIQGLKNSDANARADAAIALASAGPNASEAVPSLIQTLSDPDPVVRRLVVYALGEIGTPGASSAVPALRELFQKERDRDAQTALVNALRVLDPTAKDLKVINVRQ